MSEWISVKDRLPDTERNVLVFVNDEYGSCVRIMFPLEDYWMCPYSGLTEQSVTHWMELPEPPNE